MSDPATVSDRLLAPDALRGLAALLMVQQHLGVWLFDLSAGRRGLSPGWTLLNATGGAAAPLFVLLAGFGVVLAPQLGDGALIRRGLVLLGFGYVLNLLTPSWFGPWSFYVLHLLGSFLVLAPVLRRLGNRTLLASAAAVVVLSVAARHLLDTPRRLDHAALRDAEGLFGPLRLALVEGQFPLLPWLAFAFVGMWAGRKRHEPRALVGAALTMGLFALLLRAPVLFAPELARRAPHSLVVRLSFYPATPVFVCALLGITLALVALFVWLEEREKLDGAKLLVPLGRTSLTLLFVHILVFREGADRLGFWHTMSVLETLLTMTLFLGGWWVLSRLWSRANYRFGLEWCLRRAG